MWLTQSNRSRLRNEHDLAVVGAAPPLYLIEAREQSKSFHLLAQRTNVVEHWIERTLKKSSPYSSSVFKTSEKSSRLLRWSSTSWSSINTFSLSDRASLSLSHCFDVNKSAPDRQLAKIDAINRTMASKWLDDDITAAVLCFDQQVRQWFSIRIAIEKTRLALIGRPLRHIVVRCVHQRRMRLR